jgi:hypothetical protein
MGAAGSATGCSIEAAMGAAGSGSMAATRRSPHASVAEKESVRDPIEEFELEKGEGHFGELRCQK